MPTLAEIIAARLSGQDVKLHRTRTEANQQTAAAKNVEKELVATTERKKTLKEIIAERANQQPAITPNQQKEINKEIEENLKPFTPAEIAPEISEYTREEHEQLHKYSGAFALDIQLNEKQLAAKDLAFQGKSFALIGAAGTGKTTAQREIAKSLILQNKLSTHTFKVQGTGITWTGPSIAFVAYTRVASGNLKRAIHKDPALEEVLLHNVTTIHNLLEYEPEFYYDDIEEKDKFRFTPRRNAFNPLDITHLVIEEASMVGVGTNDVWMKLFDALRPDVQIIFIGDINQLPPVFGASILNYALVQLPVIELTTVYRQKDGSTILDNAHKILAGKTDLVYDRQFTLIEGGTIQHGQTKLAQSLRPTFEKWMDAGGYDPEEDIILSPWNKQELGTDNMNDIIAQMLGVKREAVVHQILAGRNTKYLAIGDKVLYNKQVGYITKIVHNGSYFGKAPLPASSKLTRFGTMTGVDNSEIDDTDFTLEYSGLNIEEMLEDKGEAVRAASHIVTLEMETGIEQELKSAGDFAPATFSLGYALTVHKAQGCEWRKVFLILHKDHSISAYRELFYTAITRARENVVIIAKKFMVDKCINTQRIKGNSLHEKIEWFNSGLMNQDGIYCTK